MSKAIRDVLAGMIAITVMGFTLIESCYLKLKRRFVDDDSN